MKKIKKLSLILVAFCMAFGYTSLVSAGSNDTQFSRQQISGAYYYQRDKDTGQTMVGTANKFYMNGRLAYCIEPLQQITDHTYNSTTDWSVTSLTPEQRHYIELVGYYGYEYEGHQTDRYYMATQELIWEKVRNVDAKYTTARGGGSEIDLSKEKQEILNLVQQYDIKPSFNTQTIEENIGDEISVVDENNVLDQFQLDYNGNHTVTINDNKLNIKLDDTTIGEETIRFKKNNYDKQTTLIYYKEDSQKLASLRVSDPAVATLKIKTNGASIEVDKTGEKLVLENASFHYDKIKLPNVTFALYANEDIKDTKGNIIYKKYQLIDTLKTDENGIATLENLYYGKYILLEYESSLGNLVTEERYTFEITQDDLVDGKIIKKIDFNNVLPKGQLEFTKTDIATGKPIAGATFQIFTADDRLVFTGTTGEDGKIVVDNLFVGKFYIIEKNPASGYQYSEEKVFFEIKENGEIVKANMTNEQIIEVPDTGLNDVVNVVSFVLIVGGIAFLIYAKAKGNHFKK